MNSVPQTEADQASRIGYKSRVFTVAPGAVPTRAGEVNPTWFRFVQLLGLRPLAGPEGGCWLNCQYHYAKPAPDGGYVIEAACAFDRNARFTGASYIRSCSCPDAQRRAADGAVGELRKCKHMVALAARISQCVTYPVPITNLPAEAFAPAKKRLSQAQQQAQGWKTGAWEPATGWGEGA
jgi:hypothetical protein